MDSFIGIFQGFWQLSRNTYLKKHLWTAASEEAYVIKSAVKAKKSSLVSGNWPGEKNFYHLAMLIAKCVSKYIFFFKKKHAHTNKKQNKLKKKREKEKKPRKKMRKKMCCCENEKYNVVRYCLRICSVYF